jgi:alanine racemase
MARAWADVDLGAVRRNVATLRELSAPAAVCAVVKADGYGHGAVEVSRAALDAGAAWLAVAQIDEATTLRAAGIDARILLLSEPRSVREVEAGVELDITFTVYTPTMVDTIRKAVAGNGRARQPVHLKVDTGMHRVGCDPDDAVTIAESVSRAPELDLEGVWTHCPVADEPANPFTPAQLGRFDEVLGDLARAGIHPTMRHAANSAAAIVFPASRYGLVRCGIAVYGIPPAPALAGCVELVPALRFTSEVAFVHRCAAGEGISYGLRHVFERDTSVATVPVGYADGLPRRLGERGQDVLIRGRRHPIVGVVTMDQLMIDVGPDTDVVAGDEVVLLGDQGDDRITPDNWATALDTIAYEVVCGLGPRVERRYP